MSSNENHIINLNNYEEWFVLYMDDELSAEQKVMVDHFLLLHPHLQEELDLLLGTKLPAEDISFFGKENLQADAMKLNLVDESLLLYIDNELSAAGKKAVEENVLRNSDLRLQLQLLQNTKLDATDVILYPDKKELYRHEEKVIRFPVLMRIAVAVILVLFASLFAVFNNSSQTTGADPVAVQTGRTKPQQQPVTDQKQVTLPPPTPEQPVTVVVTPTPKSIDKKNSVAVPVTKQQLPASNVMQQDEDVALQQHEAVQVDAVMLNSKELTTLNNSIAKLNVTSGASVTYNPIEDPNGTAVNDGDFKPKRSSAKGFLRKVSRFIEKRTGIGTVNADNEILVGAVALKLN